MITYLINLLIPKPLWEKSTFVLVSLLEYLPFVNKFDFLSMAIDTLQKFLRVSAEFWMETIGVIHWPKRNKLPPITNPLLLKSVTELSSKTRTGEIKVETLVTVYIERIKAVNPKLNALVGDRFNEALEEARQLDRKIEKALKDETNADLLQLPLLGIPFSIKESIAVQGQIFSGGLYSRRDFRVEEDASAVRNLKEAGAIIIGVTNVPEFLLWYDTNNHIYGRTCNPYDLSRISGGSSGGEGSLIAGAGSIAGIGSDIGGSIRIPSFFCGIFGHKPTPGIVGIDGTFPYVGHPEREKFLSIGPMCRYAVDLKTVLKVIAGPKAPLFRLDEPVDLSKSKFYFVLDDKDPLKTRVSEDVKEAIVRARNFLSNTCKFTCDDADLPLLRFSFWIWLCCMSDMDAPKLAHELTQREGSLNGWKELSKALIGKSRFRKITCLNVILEGMLYKEDTRDNQTFRNFVEKGKVLRKQLENLLDDDAILILPCLPDKPPKHNGTFLRMNNCGYTAIFNIMEVPVTQVCMGLGTKSGLPVGFQVVGKKLNDRHTLAVAELLSKEFGGWQPPCKVTVPADN